MAAQPRREGDADSPSGIRLQKVLAAAGFGSRRACELLIAAGRVSLDGKVVRTQGQRVDPRTADICVDGLRVPVAPGLVYLALNKPRGVLSTMSDARGRPCLADFVQGQSARLFHVGRLDADTEGLLLLTNDGELAHRLAHPGHGVPKTYLAAVSGPLARDVGHRLRRGVEIGEGPPVRLDSFRVVDAAGRRVLVEIVLHEGRKHVVKLALAAVGHPVDQLVRTAIGPIQLGSLRAGRSRRLTTTEVGDLYRLVGL
jgi:23S rRNA pseudouridine2605 synthase